MSENTDTMDEPLSDADYAASVGARILELAEWRGMSRMQLAGAAGLHVNAVNKMVNGHSDMRLSTLRALSAALRVEIGELLP